MRMPSFKMKRGFYCSLSLRACAITLGFINLFVSVYTIILSDAVLFGVIFRPAQALQDDFDLPAVHVNHNVTTTTTTALGDGQQRWPRPDAGSGSSGSSGSGEEAAPGSAEVTTTSTTEAPEEIGIKTFENEFRAYIITAIVFDGINVLAATADLILTTLLLYGAFTRKSAYIKPWLPIGIFMIVYDVVIFVVHCAIALYFEYSINAFFHLPLAAYLLAVSWNLYLDCRDAERRSQSARVSVTGLTKEGPEDGREGRGACTVSYDVLVDT